MTAMLAAVLAAARRLPFWVWPLLALALYAGYLHREVAKAHRAAADAKEAAAVAAEAKINERLKVYDTQARTLEAKVVDLGRQGAAAAARTRQIEVDLSAARSASEKLEAVGTLDETVQFGRSLGYNPLPARKP